MKNGIIIETPCILCAKTVRRNGVPQEDHTMLEHRYSKGETACVCHKCRERDDAWYNLTGDQGNWQRLKKVWCESPKTI